MVPNRSTGMQTEWVSEFMSQSLTKMAAYLPPVMIKLLLQKLYKSAPVFVVYEVTNIALFHSRPLMYEVGFPALSEQTAVWWHHYLPQYCRIMFPLTKQSQIIKNKVNHNIDITVSFLSKLVSEIVWWADHCEFSKLSTSTHVQVYAISELNYWSRWRVFLGTSTPAWISWLWPVQPQLYALVLDWLPSMKSIVHN